MNNYTGLDGFIWFIGIVEDVNDPEKLGRLKVRIFGDHTSNKAKIPTDILPWASVIQPIHSSAMNGMGVSPTGIVSGSTVVGFYLDGLDKQSPCIMGTLGGIPQGAPNSNIGFNDPDGKFPQSSHLNEPDTNRLATGEIEHPVTLKRGEMEEASVSTVSGSWDEPVNPYAAEYPYNSVTEYYFDNGEYGHVEEWDSTPGSERYLRWHVSNTFLEIHPDGTSVKKIIGDDFEIDLLNKHLYVKGNYTVTVDGDKEEYIKGDLKVKVDGNATTTVGGNLNRNVAGGTTETTGGNLTRSVSGNATESTSGSVNITGGTVGITGGRVDINGIKQVGE